MKADQVLIEHHNVLRALCKKITATPVETAERQDRVDELMVELDIHMRIEDELFYPAVSAASKLVAIAHAEHRQVSDQLAVFLRTAPAAPEYEGEWQAFVTTLDAHAEEEERDLFPPPVEMTDAALDALGNLMLTRMDQLRDSTIEQLRVKVRGTVLRALYTCRRHDRHAFDDVAAVTVVLGLTRKPWPAPVAGR